MAQAICIYDFKAAEDNELSVYKNEIVDIVDKSENWWTVCNKYKRSGLVPVNYLAAPITDDDTQVVARGKTKKAHIAKSENEVSIEADKQVAILDKLDNYWWFVGFCGKTGYIPKRIIHEFQRSRNTDDKDNKDKEKKDALRKFGFKQVAPDKALCEEETTILFSFQKPLPEQGKFMVIFKGEHCEKVEDGQRLNDFTIQTKSPSYYPAEDTEITINHQQTGQAQQLVVKGVKFMFQSKLDVVHKILSTESDPLNFLCSSFQIGDLQNVDLILSGNFEKKVPEGVDLLKSSKSVLVHEQVLPKETPTLLHFAAYYNLKKLAKALLRCPGAKEAMSIKNCHGNGPVGVAKLKKHSEMEQLLQDHQASENIDDLGDEDEYMSMERCYESYVEMGGKSPQYVVPDYRKRSESAVDDGEQLYEDMGGKSEPEELYDTPRSETDDRFEGYDEELDHNDNTMQQRESAMQKQIDEYKVFGRMTEKEVQLALLMKRVKERYITQEQALEMARVLRLDPQAHSTDSKKKKLKVKKRVSVPNINEALERKTQSLPRTMSTSSGSSVSSVSSVGSTGSGYASDGINSRPPALAKPKKLPGGFSYLGQPQVSPKKTVAPPPTAPRKPPTRTPSDPAPPVPSRRGARR